MKRCSNCGKRKPLREFYRHGEGNGGVCPHQEERGQSRSGAPNGKRWRYGRASSTARAKEGRTLRRSR